MSISVAIEEAYASSDSRGPVLTAATIDHPSFDAPIYVVAGADDLASDDDPTVVMLPLVSGGPQVAHKAVEFTLVAPGQEADGPTDGRLRVDGVSVLLREPLQSAVGYGQAVTIDFRQYLVITDAPGALVAPDEIIPGLELRAASIQADYVEGSLAWPDGRLFNVPTGPNAFFDPANYPALFS